MVQPPRANPAPDVRPLVPRDLVNQAQDGALVTLAMKVQTIHHRKTSLGREWAVIDGLWRGHSLRCVAFPNLWEVTDHPHTVDGITVRGQLSYRDAVPTVWVHHLNHATVITDSDSQPEKV